MTGSNKPQMRAESATGWQKKGRATSGCVCLGKGRDSKAVTSSGTE